MSVNYSIIQPPFTLRFTEMTKDGLRSYASWFHTSVPKRIRELAGAVKDTKGFEDWKPDLTPGSLTLLGDWFLEAVELRQRTADEVQEISSRLTFPVAIPGEDLTNRAFSIAMDIGMYFGAVIVNNVSGARWDQNLKSKSFADYGQPIIVGLGKTPLNPVRIAVTLAYSFASKEQPGSRLRELYDTWAKKAA